MPKNSMPLMFGLVSAIRSSILQGTEKKVYITIASFFQNRERVASKVHRQETLDGLKKFNARRKLKVSPG